MAKTKPNKDYINLKIENLDRLITNANSPEQAEIYEGYRQFWLKKAGKDGVAIKEVNEVFPEELKADMQPLKEEPLGVIISKPTDEIKEGAVEEITGKIEETQVETITEIKKAIDEDHTDIVVGNKIRCPECLGIYTKGAGFAAHYRSQHEEVKDVSTPEDPIND